MSNCFKKIIFHVKLLRTGFVANDKWRQAPGFDLLRHIYKIQHSPVCGPV